MENDFHLVRNQSKKVPLGIPDNQIPDEIPEETYNRTTLMNFLEKQKDEREIKYYITKSWKKEVLETFEEFRQVSLHIDPGKPHTLHLDFKFKLCPGIQIH